MADSMTNFLFICRQDMHSSLGSRPMESAAFRMSGDSSKNLPSARLMWDKSADNNIANWSACWAKSTKTCSTSFASAFVSMVSIKAHLARWSSCLSRVPLSSLDNATTASRSSKPCSALNFVRSKTFTWSATSSMLSFTSCKLKSRSNIASKPAMLCRTSSLSAFASSMASTLFSMANILALLIRLCSALFFSWRCRVARSISNCTFWPWFSSANFANSRAFVSFCIKYHHVRTHSLQCALAY
mmetsp:Transcript_44183/g.127612  ORF Transcript_44183/g.127612 Transcript_44183/m.127612 type:complete len:243 (+) Transcript_44183:559-1287(+)